MRYILSFLTFLVGIVIFVKCTNEPELIEYSYSIERVWWTHEMDSNDDGYTQYKRLNLDIRLKEDVIRTGNARLYYKLKNASEYSFYAYSQEQQVAGKNTENQFTIPVGASPNRRLPRGTYDFLIEFYEKDNSNIKAVSDSTYDEFLLNNLIESPDNDNAIELTVWWDSYFDFNGNGFNRHARLIVDADIMQDTLGSSAITKSVLPKIYYKLKSEGQYQIYKELDAVEIRGAEVADTFSCVIGYGNEEIGRNETELEYGEYDFMVELYDPGNNKLIVFADHLTPILSGQKFESKRDDSYQYTIANPEWSAEVDSDGDEHTVFRKLRFNVKVDKNATRYIYAKIYSHADTTGAQDSLEYVQYDSTATFSINGNNTDNFIEVDVGTISPNSNKALDSCNYHFFISVFDNVRQIDTVETFVAAIGPFTDSTLFQQKFEQVEKDSLK